MAVSCAPPMAALDRQQPVATGSTRLNAVSHHFLATVSTSAEIPNAILLFKAGLYRSDASIPRCRALETTRHKALRAPTDLQPDNPRATRFLVRLGEIDQAERIYEAWRHVRPKVTVMRMLCLRAMSTPRLAPQVR